MLRVGIWGSIVAAICCVTPVLVWLLPALGLAGWLTWIDLPLFGALIFFLALAGFGFVRRRRRTAMAGADSS